MSLPDYFVESPGPHSHCQRRFRTDIRSRRILLMIGRNVTGGCIEQAVLVRVIVEVGSEPCSHG